MVFLIEGVDGCGKSTVVQSLRELYPEITYVKEFYPGDSLEERLIRVKTLSNHINSTEVVVYDRATALDEFVYEPILAGVGGKDPMLDWNKVHPMISKCGIIYLDCSSAVARKRLEDRGD